MTGTEIECRDRAERQHGLLSRAQAFAIGMTRQQLSHRLSSNVWTRLYRGVYRLGPAPETHLQRLTAAVLWLGEDGLVSHEAAAWLWKFPGFEPCVELSIASSSHWTGPGFRVHSAPDLAPNDINHREGLKVTSAARTLFDIAAASPDHELAVAMDDVLRRGLASPGQLRKLLARLGGNGKAGTLRFRAVMKERLRHDASGDSPPETTLRRLIRQVGLPDPVPQFSIWLGKPCRIDLAYPREKIAIEIQSEEFHEGRGAVRKDSARFTELARQGWMTLPVTPAQLEEDPASFLTALAECLAARLAA